MVKDDVTSKEFAVYQFTPEMKESLKRDMRDPGYVDMVRRMEQAARTWMLLHPTAELLWHDTRGMMFMAADLDKRAGLLAKSPSAFELLRYMDERTEKKGSLMQAIFALGYMGVIER